MAGTSRYMAILASKFTIRIHSRQLLIHSSISNYVNNQVTITSSQSSSEAGTLDASSAVNFVNAGLKVYNINFANTFGTTAQVNKSKTKLHEIGQLIFAYRR